MDAVKFLEERKRMYESGAATPSIRLGDNYTPERAVKIVEEWAAAHPRKTRQSVFLEQWPNAKVGDNGVLCIYPCIVDQNMKSNEHCNNTYCLVCRREFWGKVVE